MKQKKGLFIVGFLAAFLSAFPVCAQHDTVNLHEVRISSVANSVNRKQIPRQIVIIGQKTIRALPAVSAAEILEQSAGVDVRQRGVFGMQSDLNLDGGSFDQALLLINGIPVSDPQTGHHNLDQVLNLMDIQKIEIVRGPASRWFGANAFSGAVNIITRQSTGNSLTFDVHAGQYGLFSSALSANYQTGKIDQQTSFSWNRSDGYRVNTDFRNLSVSHQSFLETKDCQYHLMLGYADKAFGANSFYTARFPDQYEKVKVMTSGLSVKNRPQWQHPWQFNGSVYWRRLYDRFELFREGEGWYQKEGDWLVKDGDSAGFHTPDGFFPYQGPNFHRTDVTGAQASVRFHSQLGKTSTGASWQYQRIVSNVLGVPMHDTIFSSIDPGAFYTRQKGRHLLNLFVNQLVRKKFFSLSVGINGLYNVDYGLLLSPGMDFSWFPKKDLKLYFSVNRANRLPTFTDLYYKGPDHISNPDLKPEKAWGFSTGMQYFFGQVTLSLDFSYRIASDLIDWIKTDPDLPWESMNLTKMNTFGTGFSLQYRPKAASAFLKSLQIHYQFLHADKEANGYVSLYALDYLRHHFSLFVQHKVLRKLTAGWTFQVQKRNGDYYNYPDNDKVPYATVFLVNMKLQYRIPHFRFYLQVNNLLDRPYRDIGSVEMPGIWALAGVRYRLNFRKKSK